MDERLSASALLVRAHVYKHAGSSARVVQVHVEDAAYYMTTRDSGLGDCSRSRLLALRRLRPDYEIWRDFAYEYEKNRPAIDVINGSDLLRRSVIDSVATPADFGGADGSRRRLVGAASARRCSSTKKLLIFA